MMQDGVCRFQPTCTEYAVEAIKKLPIHIAVFFIIKRVLRCHPFNKGGYDPVPEKTTQSHVIMGECRKVF